MFAQLFPRDREAKEDLFYGQVATIGARWCLIVAGIGLALWTTDNVANLGLPIAAMVGLMLMNFYLHGRYLTRQPANGALVALSSVIDVAAITVIVAFWSHGGGTGMQSPFFVFYFPTLLAVALVFRPGFSLPFAGVALAAYVCVVLATSGVASVNELKVMVERLLTLGATAGLGAYYWRMQRSGRRTVEYENLLREVDEAVGRPAVEAPIR